MRKTGEITSWNEITGVYSNISCIGVSPTLSSCRCAHQLGAIRGAIAALYEVRAQHAHVHLRSGAGFRIKQTVLL